MFDYIIGSKTLELVVIIAIVILIGIFITLFAKHKDIRKFLSTLVVIIVFTGLIFSASFSIININKYYNTKGGIKGALNEIFKQNEVVIDTKELNFNFKNISLIQNEDNSYSAEFKTSNVIKLDADENYTLYINKIPIIITTYSDDYFTADYTYTFFGNDRKEILTDTLNIYISFYENETNVLISTDYAKTHDNAESIDLWNSYFNKNSFMMTIKKDKTSLIQKSIFKVNLFVQNELYKTINIIEGYSYELPTKLNIFGYKFLNWRNGDVEIEKIESITQDYSLIAEFEMHAGLYDNKNNLIYTWEQLLSNHGFSITEHQGLNMLETGRTIHDDQNYSFKGKLFIPDGIQIIQSYSFSKLMGLEEIRLPNDLKELGIGVFFDCHDLKNLKLPSSLKIINSSCFYGCESLENLVIPSTVQELYGNGIFDHCTSLKSVYISNKTLLNWDYDTSEHEYSYNSLFYGCDPSLIIYLGYNSQPDTWCKDWNKTATLSTQNIELSVKWNYSYNEYLQEITNKGETT